MKKCIFITIAKNKIITQRVLTSIIPFDLLTCSPKSLNKFCFAVCFLVLLSPFVALSQPPAITSFTPANGPTGSAGTTIVTITGSGFNTTPANNIVFFGNMRAVASAADATGNSISVKAPAGASFGTLSVLNKDNGLIGWAYKNAPFIATFSTPAVINATSLASAVIFNTTTSAEVEAIGDLDNDGKPDIVNTNYNSASISVFRNIAVPGSITITSLAAIGNFSTSSNPLDVKLSDFDGDGYADIVTTNRGSSSMINVFRNTSMTPGTISLGTKVDFTTGTNPQFFVIGDIDGDGKTDIIVPNQSSNTISVFRNTISTPGTFSGSSFATKVDFTTGSNPRSVAVNDLDGDGKPDIVCINSANNTISVFKNTSTSGSILLTAKVDFGTGITPTGVKIADIDGDGKKDIICTNAGGASISVLRNTSLAIGTISFATKIDFTAGTSPQFLDVGDIDGDGKPDIVCGNNTSNTFSIFKNTSSAGTISLASAVNFTTADDCRGINIADIDGDGLPDIIVSKYTSPNYFMIYRNMIKIKINIPFSLPF